MPVQKILIDGSSLLYQSWYALLRANLRTPDGRPSGAIRGFNNTLDALIARYPEAELLVVFDPKGDSFRQQLYAPYKATRESMPDDLRGQIAPIHQLVQARGLPLLIPPQQQGGPMEADDLIATLARHYSQQGRQTLIYSRDKDLAQCVDERVGLLRAVDDAPMDAAAVEDKYGVPPSLIPDFLALTGDSSDNIPGVSGVGPGTAVRLLKEHGSLDNVSKSAADIKGKLGERVRDAAEDLPLYLDLVLLRDDMSLNDFDLDGAEPDPAALEALYAELGFAEAPMPTAQKDRPPIEMLDSVPAALDWLRAGLKNPPVALFFAPDDPRLPHSPAAGLGLADGSGRRAFLPLDRDATLANTPPQLFAPPRQPPGRSAKPAATAAPQAGSSGHSAKPAATAASAGRSSGRGAQTADAATTAGRSSGQGAQTADAAATRPSGRGADTADAAAVGQIAEELRQRPGQWLAPDLKAAMLKAAAALGLELPQQGGEDPLLRSYVLDPSGVRHELEPLCRQLGLSLASWESVAGKGAAQVPLSQLPPTERAELAANRAAAAVEIDKTLAAKMVAEPALTAIYRDLELALVPVLADMEAVGVFVDSGELQRQSEQLEKQTATLQQLAWKEAGEEFNLDSPSQTGQILFEKLKLPVLSKTRGGKPSTSEGVLQELSDRGHPLPALVLEHRGLRKLLSTYTQKLPQEIDPRTGRVHTSYDQRVAATGRLSSSHPNLQNIPIRTAAGRRIRHAFRAADGCRLLTADYSQIELRIMAHLSDDRGLIEAFTSDADVHAATARELFGRVDDEGRRRAKAVNFGLMYGMSAFGLARQLKVDQKDAQHFMDTYFARFPGARAFMDSIRDRATSDGYVETLWGRRLYLPDIGSRNHVQHQAAIRAAINAPMQGTAADIIKKAMIEVHLWLKSEPDGRRGQLLMQVHDELVLEIPAASLDETRAAVVQRMEGAADLKVALQVEVGVGDNWEEAKS